mmetsp:Transcript_18132/g.47141  ORF Transcript_18132/g.47141 Transcript_18132/m.47141 type:complete len:100 (-) Transcript_18132:97-396(-)
MPKDDDITTFSKLKEEVNLALPQCIERVLGKVAEYHPKHVEEWSESVGQEVLKKLQATSSTSSQPASWRRRGPASTLVRRCSGTLTPMAPSATDGRTRQ